jgi:GT2 family glycosyltransferase
LLADLDAPMTPALRAVAGRLRARARQRSGYEDFVAEVEPGLTERPRVHRFAAPPVVGEPGLAPESLAVCVDPSAGGDVAATHFSLGRQSAGAAQVLERPLRQALTDSRARWLAVVAAGDRLAPRALERLGQAAALAPDAQVITCDEDVVRGDGRRREPRLHPGPSPDAVAAGTIAPPAVLMAREAALAAAVDGDGSERELLGALAGPAGARHAHLPQILLHRAARSTRAETSARSPTLAAEPAVEAIVCFRDRPELLERCVRSVLEVSTYERLSLRLVDNDSREPTTARLLDRLDRDPRVSLMRDERPFNFAALNNRALAQSQADVVVLLNNDTEVQSADWVQGLAAHALREEVGAVAPLLTYPDGRVQHAGAALGLYGYAGHPFAGLAPDRRTAFGAAADGPRNWLAVTAACLMVERRKLVAVGGFDESFAVGGNDVDVCLRLTDAGHRSLCLPHVRLGHRESASRDPNAIPAGDFQRSRRRYGAFRTVGDPFYNPNLTLAATDCSLRSPGEMRA